MHVRDSFVCRSSRELCGEAAALTLGARVGKNAVLTYVAGHSVRLLADMLPKLGRLLSRLRPADGDSPVAMMLSGCWNAQRPFICKHSLTFAVSAIKALTSIRK